MVRASPLCDAPAAAASVTLAPPPTLALPAGRVSWETTNWSCFTTVTRTTALVPSVACTVKVSVADWFGASASAAELVL